MKISELIAHLANVQREQGDIEVVCMTAPYGDGETEVLTEELLDITRGRPNNGLAVTDQVVLIGCNRS